MDHAVVGIVAFFVGIPLMVISVIIWPPKRKSILDIAPDSVNIELNNQEKGK